MEVPVRVMRSSGYLPGETSGIKYQVPHSTVVTEISAQPSELGCPRRPPACSRLSANGILYASPPLPPHLTEREVKSYRRIAIQKVYTPCDHPWSFICSSILLLPLRS
jgi:hypothetical protein